jgi:hypothetical protein
MEEQDGMAYPRSRLALALFLSTLLWSATAPAQLLPAAPDTPEAPEAQSATGQENARVLAEIPQDEQARQAPIDQLWQVAAGGVASGAAAGEAVDPHDDVTIAREAAESLGEVTGGVTDWVARLRGVARTARHHRGDHRHLSRCPPARGLRLSHGAQVKP